MARKSFNLSIEDQTITVKVGRNIYSIDKTYKTKAEIYDEVKYALIMMDVSLEEVSLMELLRGEE